MKSEIYEKQFVPKTPILQTGINYWEKTVECFKDSESEQLYPQIESCSQRKFLLNNKVEALLRVNNGHKTVISTPFDKKNSVKFHGYSFFESISSCWNAKTVSYLLVHLDVQPVRHFVVLGKERWKQGQNSAPLLFFSPKPETTAGPLPKHSESIQTHHHIVSLHLGFLAGQLLALQFQTATRWRDVK